MSRWNRPVGFRAAPWDPVVLVLAIVAVALLWRPLQPAAWLVATVVLHFFLFCNVFRVRRALELIWSGIFLANVAVFAFIGHIDGALVLLCQLPVTVAVILMEVRSPRYHGVFSRRAS